MLVSVGSLSSLLRGLHSLLKPRPLYCTCYRRAVQIPTAAWEVIDSTCLEPSSEVKPLDSFYTPEQRATILTLLNTGSETDLSVVKLLRGQKLNSILEYRTRNGYFEDLESVLKVPLLKHKSAVIVFNSILNPSERKKRKNQKIQLERFINPPVDKTHLEAATSIISIVCGTNRIAWTHMDQAQCVLDWKQEDCPNFMNKTYMASSYLADVSAVVSNLPAADLFVVEKPGVSSQNPALFSVMAHLRTVEAMLFALLSRPLQTDSAPKVLNMMRNTVGRHFDLMIGDSRVSGARIVRQMMTESLMNKCPRVTFPKELLIRYKEAFQISTRNKENEMCDALLQAVAFYELLKDQKTN